ncbi:hypothetical protein AKJ16_DCAP19058 [Drosera capensis]
MLDNEAVRICLVLIKLIYFCLPPSNARIAEAGLYVSLCRMVIPPNIIPRHHSGDPALWLIVILISFAATASGYGFFVTNLEDDEERKGWNDKEASRKFYTAPFLG